MFGNLVNFEASLFDEFRRLERDMDQLFGATPWPSGIRAVERGTYPHLIINEIKKIAPVLGGRSN